MEINDCTPIFSSQTLPANLNGIIFTTDQISKQVTLSIIDKFGNQYWPDLNTDAQGKVILLTNTLPDNLLNEFAGKFIFQLAIGSFIVKNKTYKKLELWFHRTTPNPLTYEVL